MHAGLCGGVVGLAELPLGAVDGGDVDDPAPAAFEHAVDEWPGDVENGVEIDAQDRIPIGVAQLAERSIARDARVVDQGCRWRCPVCVDAVSQFWQRAWSVTSAPL